MNSEGDQKLPDDSLCVTCTLLLHITFAYYFCILLLYITFAYYFCILLLHITFAYYFCMLLLHITFACYFCILLHIFAYYFCILLLQYCVLLCNKIQNRCPATFPHRYIIAKSNLASWNKFRSGQYYFCKTFVTFAKHLLLCYFC